MKRAGSGFAALVILTALAGAAWPASGRLAAQTKATAASVPVIPHEAVPGFFKNPPGIYTGENMGIATGSSRRPMVISTLPAGLNLINMSVPSSTAQMLSSASTRTEWAKAKP